MIYTFKINTNNLKTNIETITKYCQARNIDLSPTDIRSISKLINDKSYMYVDEVKASSEDNAWDKVDDTRVIEELEITDIDYSDEIEAEEKAKAHWEALEEDRYMDYVRGID